MPPVEVTARFSRAILWFTRSIVPKSFQRKRIEVRTHLLQCRGGGHKVIQITSPDRVRKTTLAANLAVSIAHSQEKCW